MALFAAEIYASPHQKDDHLWVQEKASELAEAFDDTYIARQLIVETTPDGAVLGAADVDVKQNAAYQSNAVLRHLAVDQSGRGLGIGSALLQSAEQYAASQDASVIDTVVAHDFATDQNNLIEWYRARGYSDVNVYVGGVHPTLRKQL